MMVAQGRAKRRPGYQSQLQNHLSHLGEGEGGVGLFGARVAVP
jgi:hypothetical protein